ncbi:hypothetical protein H257_06542 [Aphanomyces astaci]|uniref:Uncharacterized protein n=1 Tax=Aphanomyces astaci TaxID=112090 RepID=W4GKG7_APHAT|nr:hypothetical protein H257_06542 [Aphanomyces astaci]ETV80180.1 hypothetical protein H257_06542 [Aphanomyces astaci]|eukprot:XP_009830104.1 hypothetical protein H257_06542 [Aphanomyces astaci]
MPPKWVWTCIPPSNVSPLWNIEPSATKDITSFSVKFKQLVSFAALQLTTDAPSGQDLRLGTTALPFPLTSVVVVDGSINRMRSLDGILVFSNVRELRLSLNQLSTLPPLNHLVHLRLLYLGNNYLTSLTWLWHPNTLTHLDVTGNNIASLAGVDACRSCLHVLNVSENKLVSLDGVQHLLQLRELWGHVNELQDDSSFVHVLPLCHLRVLSLGQNRLSNLDTVASVVLGLPNLDDVSFVNNPVADCDLYRMRLCQHPRLRVLDHKTITTAMRQSFTRMRNTQDVEALVEQTTLGYLAHVDMQKHVLDQGIRFHRAREQRMTDAFTQYKHNMERELDDCVHFAHVLSTAQARSAGYLMSNAGLEEWKRQLQTLHIPPLDDATAATALEPHAWRRVKHVEMDHRQALNQQRGNHDVASPHSSTQMARWEQSRRVEAALALASKLNVGDAAPKMRPILDCLQTTHEAYVVEKERLARTIQRTWRRHHHSVNTNQNAIQTVDSVAAAAVKATSNKFRFWRRSTKARR